MGKIMLNKKTGLLSATLLLAAMTPALAQSLLLDEPAAAVVKEQVAATPNTATTTSLVPFQEDASAMTLSGEADDIALTFSVSDQQLSAGGILQFGYQNAVSVLPDTSLVEVELNGKALGSFPVRSPNGISLQSFPVAAADLKPGRNRVSLHGKQMHRVDCSLEATYELWTKIDPAKSGFLSGKVQSFARVQDLAGVGKTSAGFTDIRLIMPKTVSAEQINSALPLVQIVSLYLNRTDVQVTVSDTPGSGPGIDLFAGDDLSSLTREPGMERLAAAPYGLAVANGASSDRAVVTLKSARPEELRSALLTQVRGAMSDGFKTGIFSKSVGTVQAEAGKTFTLADAGYRTRAFSGHLSHTHFKLVMPADFYPADYATIDMELHAATSPGLDPNSQLLIRVNDRVVTSYPFRDRDGQQFNGKRIAMPLRAFHPGVNTIDILAEVPKASDASCQPGANVDKKPRFLLLENTSISIPALARVARLPDLAALAGKAYPFQGGKPFDVFVEKPTPATLGSALTLMSRLSLSAGNPLNASIKFAAPDETTTGNILVIGTSNEALPEMTPAKSVDGVFGALGGSNVDPTKTGGIAAQAKSLADLADADPQALLDAFQQSAASDIQTTSATTSVRSFLTSAAQRFGLWLRYDSPAKSSQAASNGDVLVSVSQSDAPSGNGTWTVVNAGNEDDLAKGTNRLISDTVWSSLNGGTALIRASDGALETAAASGRLVSEFTDVTPGNLRRLAAAWFSDNFTIYVGLVLALMGFFALWLGRTVPKNGVRTDQ